MNPMYKILHKVHVISALMTLSAGYSKAQNLNLIPYPSQVEILKGTCVLNNALLYTNNKALSDLLHFQKEEILPEKIHSRIPKQLVDLKIQSSANAYGSYELVTSENKVSITAADTAGLFNGIVTLIQLIQLYNTATPTFKDKLVLPRVVDSRVSPDLSGEVLCWMSRAIFFGKRDCKTGYWTGWPLQAEPFSLALGDSQGWRIEIKKYPLLTTVAEAKGILLVTHWQKLRIIPRKIFGKSLTMQKTDLLRSFLK